MTEYVQVMLISTLFRIACLLAGFTFGYLGYRLYVIGVFEKAQELKAGFGKANVTLKQVAPGVVFGAAGVVISILSIVRPVVLDRTTYANPIPANPPAAAKSNEPVAPESNEPFAAKVQSTTKPKTAIQQSRTHSFAVVGDPRPMPTPQAPTETDAKLLDQPSASTELPKEPAPTRVTAKTDSSTPATSVYVLEHLSISNVGSSSGALGKRFDPGVMVQQFHTENLEQPKIPSLSCGFGNCDQQLKDRLARRILRDPVLQKKETDQH